MRKLILVVTFLFLMLSCTKTQEKVVEVDAALEDSGYVVPVRFIGFHSNVFFGKEIDYSYLVNGENHDFSFSIPPNSPLNAGITGQFTLAKVDESNPKKHYLLIDHSFDKPEQAQAAADSLNAL